MVRVQAYLVPIHVNSGIFQGKNSIQELLLCNRISPLYGVQHA